MDINHCLAALAPLHPACNPDRLVRHAACLYWHARFVCDLSVLVLHFFFLSFFRYVSFLAQVEGGVVIRCGVV